jgi:succinate-semialdehyde dehydrogenase/glutarate-semialdehyde dehydrogenase
MTALRLVGRHDHSSQIAPSLNDLARQVQSADGRVMTITNAMTGEPLGQVPSCTSGDVAAAAARARAVQANWATRPVSERAEVLLRFHDLVLARQDEVLDLIQQENGKARRHAFEEVMDVCLTYRRIQPLAPNNPAVPAGAPGALRLPRVEIPQ